MICEYKYCQVLVTMIVALVLLAGCSSIPPNHPDLLRAQVAYEKARSEPNVSKNAPVEIHEADLALQQAQQVEDLEDLKHLSYVAERQAQIAVAAARQRQAKKEIARLAQEKDKVLLEAREAEVQSKTREVEAREREAELARTEAAKSKDRSLQLAQEAELAKKEAEAKAREAEQARSQAELAQKLAKKLEMEIAELNAKKTDRGLVLTLGDVLFEFDRAELMTGAFRTIDKLVEFLKKHEKRNVLIEGHTDSIGTPEYNIGLSERRAEEVRNSLLQRGISPVRIIAKGYGESYPVATNVYESGRQQNRRVEIIILNEGVSAKSKMR
jgi:outer membrane protein OmpA-like peptidoglycan-associated protein